MKILFVCSGNSGRSPMAQFVMRDLVDKAGLGDKISVASAASKVVDADKLHAGIAAKLREENIPFGEHTAHTITPDDYASSDMIVCVDAKSAAQVKELIGDPDGKISTLLDTDIHWDKNGFAKTFDDIKRGCENLLTRLGG